MTDLDDRTEWLLWRKAGIGASDVAALVGMSPWASPMSVWTDKMGLTPLNDDNDYMEFGRRAEPMLVGYFEDRRPGLFVVDTQARAQHPEFPHHRATLDGRVAEHPDGDPVGLVEFKTGGFEKWDAGIPDNYACQVQWQLHVDQRDHAWIGALHGRTFAVYEVERDQRAIDFLVGEVDRFWVDNVLGEKPPAADAHKATAKALGLAFPDPAEGETVALDDLSWAVDLRDAAKAQFAAAKVDIARAENYIKAAIGGAEIGTINGAPAVTWKRSHRDGYAVQPWDGRTLRRTGEK